jgi:hypothetical protein
MYSNFLILLSLLLITLIIPQRVNAQLLINEFSPKNPEWVEIINVGNNEINLAGYYFDDDSDFNSDSGNSTKVLLNGLFQPNNLCFIDINSYLNDGGDIPTIFAPNGDILDSYSYSSSSANLSYSRVPDAGGWQVGTVFSKTLNSCSLLPTPSPTPTQIPTIEPTNVPIITISPTSAPTAQPTVKPSPTKSPSPKPSVTPKPTEVPEDTDKPSINLEFGQGNIIESTETPEGKVAGIKTTNKSPVLAIVLVLAGLGCLGYVGYMLYNMKNEVH